MALLVAVYVMPIQWLMPFCGCLATPLALAKDGAKNGMAEYWVDSHLKITRPVHNVTMDQAYHYIMLHGSQYVMMLWKSK